MFSVHLPRGTGCARDGDAEESADAAEGVAAESTDADVDEADTLFEMPGEGIEKGLDVDDPALLQLRKACRLLTATEFLEDYNGYYTVVIEASFSAIERTIQFYLLHRDFLAPEEYVDHTAVYRHGEKAGLYNDEIREADRSMEK